ncbi:MAG: hypothetical protein FD129_1975 [bacterium]|nr:MAG: hypothetical protein FD129_1975 [bacterium]
MRETRSPAAMSVHRRYSVGLTLLAALIMAGCGEMPRVTAPASALPAGRADDTANPPLEPANSKSTEDAAGGAGGDIWKLVAMSTVGPLQLKTVTGSRYSLLFLPGSVLGQPITVTIHERNPDIIDIKLGPHGTQFGVPVTLTIYYGGTTLDPAHPKFKPGPLQFYWLDPLPLVWLPIPGVDNPETKTYTVTLTHFSRYTMSRSEPSGTADW